MLFIMGFSSWVVSICSLFPQGSESWLARTMEHAQWHGLTHHDTIFPLFLFIAGISWPYSYASQLGKGASQKQIYLKIARRALTLIGLGILYNGFFDLDFAQLRICSVLGRIGAAWAIAALLFIHFRPKTRLFISAGILIGYWLLLYFVPAPDVAHASPYTIEGNLVGYIDRCITPGQLYFDGVRFDPEGLLSTLPAVVTAMLGMFTGEFVRHSDPKIDGRRKAGYMGVAALGLLLVGGAWSILFPLNKMLWTSSFVLVVGSYSLALFALFYYVIDVKKCQKWTLFFRVIGLNSITIYMAQKIIDFDSANEFFFNGLASLLPEPWAEVLLNTGYVAICWLFLYFLYKKQIFLKV